MLQAIGLTKTYQSKVALDNLHLRVNAGDIFCLLGQNGAGKTTTIQLFLGFIKANSGKAMVNGLEVKPPYHDTRKFLAYIPEVVMLYGHLSSIENLDFFSRVAGFVYSRSKLEYFLDRVGLQRAAFDQRVATYSKGMRQKVGIAIALAKNAHALLMDEPTSGLDPKATNEFTALIKSLGDEGKAVLMATHDIFNAVELGSKVGIMKAGQLLSQQATTHLSARELQDLYLKTY